MTLRKQNPKKHSISTKSKLSRASKALFSKPPKARPVHTQYVTPTINKPKEDDKDVDVYSIPSDVADRIDNVARRMTVSSVAKDDKKPAVPKKLDIVSSPAALPSATSRPIINDGHPLIRKRTMLSQPPSSMEVSDTMQAAGSDAETPADAASKVEAPSSASLINKLTSRPAKPLTTKPVAAGPTVSELLDIKQKAADEAAEMSVKLSQPAVVNDVTAPSKTPSLVKSSETPAVTAAVETKSEPVSPKPQLIDSTRPKSEDKPADKATDEDDIKPEELTDSKHEAHTEKTEAVKPEAQPASQPAVKLKDDSDDKPADDDAKPLPVADTDTKDSSSSGTDDMGNLQKDLTAEKPEPTPPPKAELYGGRPVIIIHEAHPFLDFLKGLLVFVIGLIVIAAAVNFLLDAGIIETGYDIPHTNFLDPK